MTDTPAPEAAAPQPEEPSSIEQLLELIEFFAIETISQLANDRSFASEFNNLFPSYDDVWGPLTSYDPTESHFGTIGEAVRAVVDKLEDVARFAERHAEKIARLHELKRNLEEDAALGSEAEFLRHADEIAAEVIKMSDAEVDAYIKEHGLEELVAPERVEKLLREAMIAARRQPPQE